MAGVWCRTDSTRGVHKAPANEVTLGVNGLGLQITQAEQGGLNKVGINCIRSFPGRGIRIWGLHALRSDPEWRYINVRRLFNYVAESIMEGTVERSTTRSSGSSSDRGLELPHLHLERGRAVRLHAGRGVLRQVRRETNPPEVIEAGRHLRDRHRPVKPAEFVVFRLSQFSGGDGAEVEQSPQGQLQGKDGGMPANDKEAHVPIWFQLKIGGAEAAGLLQGGDRLRLRERGHRDQAVDAQRQDRRQGDGNTKWGRHRAQARHRPGQDAWNWRKMIVDGKAKEARKDCTVTMLDYMGSPVVTYSILNAWPKKYTGVGLKADSNEVAVEGNHALPRGLRDPVRRSEARVRIQRRRAASSTPRGRCIVTARCASPRRATRSSRCGRWRSRQNEAYLSVLLLARTITRIGDHTEITPDMVEDLFAADFDHLQRLYERINTDGEAVGVAACPDCAHEFEVDLTEIEDGRLGNDSPSPGGGPRGDGPARVSLPLAARRSSTPSTTDRRRFLREADAMSGTTPTEHHYDF